MSISISGAGMRLIESSLVSVACGVVGSSSSLAAG